MRTIRAHRRLALLLGTLVLIAAALPAPAYANNCSSLADCTNSIIAALVAALAITALCAYGLPLLGIVISGEATGMLAIGIGVIAGAIVASPPPSGISSGPPEGNPDLPPAPPSWGVAPSVASGVAADPNSLQDAINQMNPSGSATNCDMVTWAVSCYLATGDVTPAPPGARGASPNEMSGASGGHDVDSMSLSAIDQEMAHAPNGAQGWVIVQNSSQDQGHFYNAVNIDGHTYFIDGQSGRISNTAEGALDNHGVGLVSGFIKLW